MGRRLFLKLRNLKRACVEAIKTRRIELGLEESEDALLEDDLPPETKVIPEAERVPNPPLEISAKEDAPYDTANITSSQLLMLLEPSLLLLRTCPEHFHEFFFLN